MKRWILASFTLFLILSSCTVRQQIRFPGAEWEKYTDPAQAGWSAEKLAEARDFSDSIGVTTLMIVENGIVVDAWGDLARRFMCHSVRKSFISALYGIHVGRGEISLGETLASLGIQDKDSLTAAEQQATIRDLLQARSGVYHPAAYETPSMKASRPARGSHPHGTFYYYNNWDFNILAHIFRMKTGMDVFTAFRDEIASPIGMNDFRLEDTYFHLEPEHSIYPAYPFRMSTRDAARFGLLYLANGRWGDRQIIPAGWVADSRTPWTRSAWPELGYGYLWWVPEDSVLQSVGMYNASGVGGQIIAVLPGAGLVIVQRVNTYEGKSVPYKESVRLFRMILEARTGRAQAKPETTALEVPVLSTLPVDSLLLEKLPGIYADPEGDTLAFIVGEENHLRVKLYEQTFNVLLMQDSTYIVEDAGIRLGFARGPGGEISSVRVELAGQQMELEPVKEEVPFP